MNIAETVKSKYRNLIVEYPDAVDATAHESIVIVKRDGIRSMAASLKSDPELQFDMLMDLFAVDYLHWEEKAFRFEVLYNLFSSKKHHRLFLKVLLSEEDPSVDSVTTVWPAANWYERETWDMMGIEFRGHPNLKRILMYEGFKGHALRKDYRYNQRQPIIGPMN